MSIIITNFVKKYFIQFNQPFRQLLLNFSTNSSLNKQIIDKSKVPVLNEKDLKEEFIHGSGPGGQNVNKLSNCVQLTHLPTGIVVKCHQNREQHRNRVIARELLTSKLDDLINREQSVSSQRHRMILDRESKRDKRREKIRELKKVFKEDLKLRAVLNSDKDIQNDSDVSRNN